MVPRRSTPRVLILCCYILIGSTKTSAAQRVSDDLFNRMIQVETGGNECAVGDNGRSLGPLQIMEKYYNDAVQQNPSLKDNGRSYRDVVGIGSTEYSKEVVQSYMDRYATESRLGHKPTDEDIARIHNGGPNGYKNPATEGYWKSVQNANPVGRRKRAAFEPDLQNITVQGCKSASPCSLGQCCSSKGVCNCFALSSFSWTKCNVTDTSKSSQSSVTADVCVLLTMVMCFWLFSLNAILYLA